MDDLPVLEPRPFREPARGPPGDPGSTAGSSWFEARWQLRRAAQRMHPPRVSGAMVARAGSTTAHATVDTSTSWATTSTASASALSAEKSGRERVLFVSNERRISIEMLDWLRGASGLGP